MKSTCICCNKKFSYMPSQSKGLYCSNACQGKHTRAQKVESGVVGDIRTVRRYLIENNIYECVKCGNKGEHNNQPLSLQLDHIDGNSKNHRLNNVRWLCPNCHTQTSNWGTLNMSPEGRQRCKTNVLNPI